MGNQTPPPSVSHKRVWVLEVFFYSRAGWDMARHSRCPQAPQFPSQSSIAGQKFNAFLVYEIPWSFIRWEAGFQQASFAYFWPRRDFTRQTWFTQMVRSSVNSGDSTDEFCVDMRHHVPHQFTPKLQTGLLIMRKKTHLKNLFLEPYLEIQMYKYHICAIVSKGVKTKRLGNLCAFLWLICLIYRPTLLSFCFSHRVFRSDQALDSSRNYILHRG